MRLLRNVVRVFVMVFGVALGLSGCTSISKTREDYVNEPMPVGFKVVMNELEGPVFTDPYGHTLYRWPTKALRNGLAGDSPGKPTCGDDVYRENAGLMSPYPGGLELPEVEKRQSCSQLWPPVLAAAKARAVGNWTLVDRPDGRKQWAYEGWPLYTSVFDKRPGDVLGGSRLAPEEDRAPGASGALRRPITPKPNIPPQFAIFRSMVGRSVELTNGRSVYVSDRDSRDKSSCYDACLEDWEPILAPEAARTLGEWTTFERAPGVRQWAFRGKPVYRRLADIEFHSQEGSDIPGWHNVYTQKVPPPPSGFTVKDTAIGSVLGDARGMTVYRYNCTDDAPDQQLCDHPEAPQVYRLAICGGGDVETCLRAFPYIVAPADAKVGNRTWGTMHINPRTGKRASAEEAGSLNVWTFRGRPIYTFAGRKHYGDRTPADVNAHNWGEWFGSRNGFQAIVFRHHLRPM